MQSPQSDDIIVAGQLGGSYGVKGWIKIISHTNPKENLLALAPWWLNIQGHWQLYDVEDIKLHGKGIIAKLKGVESPEQAKLLTHVKLGVAAESLPELEEGEYYWRDLIGLQVVNAEGVSFGRIKQLIETGANDVMQVEGDKERLLPYIDDVVLDVDLQKGLMIVLWDADF